MVRTERDEGRRDLEVIRIDPILLILQFLYEVRVDPHMLHDPHYTVTSCSKKNRRTFPSV